MPDAPEAIPDDEFSRQQTEHMLLMSEDSEDEPEHDSPEEIDIIGDEEGRPHPEQTVTLNELGRLEERLTVIEETITGLRDGVNVIGEMMNSVAEMFDQMVTKVNQGGIAGLLGGLMGGNKNG